MVRGCTSRSSSGSAASRRTSAARPPRRPGPVLCVAPAGSGKTTTLVARVAWLVDGGLDPGAITRRRVQQAGRRGADRAARRGARAAGRRGGRRARPDVPRAGSRDARRGRGLDRAAHRPGRAPARAVPGGHGGGPRAARPRVLAAQARPPRRLADEVAADPAPGPGRARVRGVRAGDRRVGRRRLRRPRRPRAAPARRTTRRSLARWRARCTELLVDEAQDLDRTQLELALLLAAPDNRVFLVGDDDQTIYGWRLADVRRVLGLAASLPGLRRVDLTTNYRCPRPVVERAVRLVEHNRERFAKRIDAGPNAAGRLVLAPDADDDVVRTARAMASWPADDSTRAVLSRTNRELLVAVVAALDLGLPFRAPGPRRCRSRTRGSMRCSTGWQAPHRACRSSWRSATLRRAVRAEAATRR